MNFNSEVVRLRVQLDHLMKAPNLENADAFLAQIQKNKNANFQAVQDLFLPTLLSLMDNADGM